MFSSTAESGCEDSKTFRDALQRIRSAVSPHLFSHILQECICISCLHNTVDGLSQRWDVMPLCYQTALTEVVGSLHPSASRCHLVIITPLLHHLDICIVLLTCLSSTHPLSVLEALLRYSHMRIIQY